MQIDVHVIYNRSNTTIKLEMWPVNTDAPLLQIPIFSQTNAKRHFYEQRAITLEATRLNGSF